MEYSMADTDTQNVPQVVPGKDTKFNDDERFTGRVKWFNNRSGYGFATVTGGERNNEDIFVHHSGICVAGEQYKYLVQGEYVQFSLRASDNPSHPFQADNIRGINNGQLMCETHLETKRARMTERNSRDEDYPPNNVKRSAREHIRSHGSGPREGDQWYLVKRGAKNNRRRPRRDNREMVDSSENVED